MIVFVDKPTPAVHTRLQLYNLQIPTITCPEEKEMHGSAS